MSGFIEAPTRPVVGVAGLGSLGAPLLLTLCAHGYDTIGVDPHPAALDRVEHSVNVLTMQRAGAAMAKLGTDPAALGVADIVIEAVPDTLGAKRDLLRLLDRVCLPEAVLVTTSDTLPLTALAAASGRPGRVLGLRLPHPPRTGAGPAARIAATVVPTAMTAPDAAELVEHLVAGLDSALTTPAAAGGPAAQAATRLVYGLLNRAVELAQEGYVSGEAIDTAMRLGCGLPAGPLRLIDEAGADRVRDRLLALRAATGDAAYRPAALLDAMVGEGALGHKAGRGFCMDADGTLATAPPIDSPTTAARLSQPAETAASGAALATAPTIAAGQAPESAAANGRVAAIRSPEPAAPTPPATSAGARAPEPVRAAASGAALATAAPIAAARAPEHAASAAANRIGVVGSGTMGQGIAETLAVAGFEVLLVARSAEKAAHARAAIAERLTRAVRRGRLAAPDRRAALDRVRPSREVAEVAGCGVVIEAIAEDLDVKTAMFARLGAHCRPDALLATSTSSLSVAACARAAGRPDSVLGLHFFNPVPVMPLVELAVTPDTGAPALARARELCARLGKTAVECPDRTGFIVNRLLFAYLNDAIRLLESGAAEAEQIDAAVRAFGFPMGPYTLLDTIGLDVSLAILRELSAAYGPAQYDPPRLLADLVAAGSLGAKNGRGFHYRAPR